MTEKNLINIDSILNAEIIEEPWEHAVIDNIIDVSLLWENLQTFLGTLAENKDMILILNYKHIGKGYSNTPP